MKSFILIITFICLLTPSAHAKCYQGDCQNGQLIEEKVTQPAPVKKEKKIVPPPKKAAELPGDLPEASARLLSAADLEKKTAGELRIMLNEIYARHSHLFKSADLQEHFSRQPWYTPKQPADWSMFSDIEKANIGLIRKYLSTRN